VLILLGLNHRSAPVAVRERVAFEEADLPAALTRVTAGGVRREALILSTCNRVEILMEAEERAAAIADLEAFLARERGLTPEEIARYTYHHVGQSAARHLFRVASGLESMILGEPQILGQVRRAYHTARVSGSTGPVIDHLLQHGLAAAKRIRTETGISRHAVSVAFAAVVLARKIFGELRGRSVLLLGAGKMTELAARHLTSSGVARVVVVNRTYDAAVLLAGRLNGEAVNWDDAVSQLAHVDVVVTGTAAPEPVVKVEHVQRAMRARRNRPLFFIDLAVPRDVEPEVNDLDNVYLYDIDDLQGVVDTNLEERKKEAEKAGVLIDREVELFERWRQSLEVAPTIQALRESLHDLRRREIDRFRRRIGPLDPKQEGAVDALTHAIVQKILHLPIRHLKASAEAGRAAGCASLYREIFPIGSRDGGDDTEDADADGAEAGSGPQGIVRGGEDG
jgi:glutamyl-tRNA reductase